MAGDTKRMARIVKAAIEILDIAAKNAEVGSVESIPEHTTEEDARDYAFYAFMCVGVNVVSNRGLTKRYRATAQRLRDGWRI